MECITTLIAMADFYMLAKQKILKIASADEVDQINPDGGFVKYGLVKNDYVLVKGSLPGPSKRLVILRH